MIACKQVAKALANYRYYDLPWWRRVPMFIHIKLCVMCGESHKQIVTLQKGFRTYLENEDAGTIEPMVHLSDEAKKRMEDALKQNR